MAVPTSNTPSVRGRFTWPWQGGHSFVTPDGFRVSLAGPDLDVSRPWSASFIAAVRGARRSFTVAEAGAFEWHSTYTTVPDEIARGPYHGGELLLGIRHDPAGYRAAWRGQWFELHTSSSGPPPGPADGITRVFDAFRLTDTPQGMLVRPRSTRLARLDAVRVAKQIPGIGQLTIERPGTSLIEIPDFRGHPTRHGELWRQPLGAGAQGRSRSEALVLATCTAIVRLTAGPDDSADPNDALALLHDLDVLWEPA